MLTQRCCPHTADLILVTRHEAGVVTFSIILVRWLQTPRLGAGQGLDLVGNTQHEFLNTKHPRTAYLHLSDCPRRWLRGKQPRSPPRLFCSFWVTAAVGDMEPCCSGQHSVGTCHPRL